MAANNELDEKLTLPTSLYAAEQKKIADTGAANSILRICVAAHLPTKAKRDEIGRIHEAAITSVKLLFQGEPVITGVLLVQADSFIHIIEGMDEVL